MKPTYKEYTIVFNTENGSSVFGRLVRLIKFPFKWVLTGKAEL